MNFLYKLKRKWESLHAWAKCVCVAASIILVFVVLILSVKFLLWLFFSFGNLLARVLGIPV